MRISDNRYQQELQRLNLGLRLLRLDAKSGTIRDCTGLTEDRIRKLFRTYFEERSTSTARRKRGKSPHEPAMLMRNARIHLQSSALANLLIALEAAGTHAAASRGNTAQAERCCDAFEYYLQLFDDPEFSFEHAWLLAQLLSPNTQRSSELQLAPCSQCRAPALQHALAQQTRPCPFCGDKAAPLPRRYVRGPKPLPIKPVAH